MTQSAAPAELPFGSWPSPISAAALVSGAVGIAEIAVDGDDIWWGESRPDESGRTAIIRWRDGATVEVTPPDANVRTLVHEYGGGSWWVAAGTLYYVDLSDQRLRALEVGEEPRFLSPEPDSPRALRYADGRVTPDGQWVVAVHERHGVHGEPANELVAIPTDGSQRIVTLFGGTDFVAAPRISPDGSAIAFVSWDHPQMPWTVTTLHIYDFSGSSLGPERLRLGNGAEAWCEPGWSDSGRLLACTDRDGWWNLVELDLTDSSLEPAVAGPFEIPTPPWVFGMQRWAAVGETLVAVAGLSTGDEIIVDGQTVATPDTEINSMHAYRDGVVFAGTGFGHEATVVRLDLSGEVPRRSVIRSPRVLPVPIDVLIEPEAITFPTSDGEHAHAVYYPPTNGAAVGPTGELPPILVLAHGGPTAAARRALQLALLYWTSRGIAVVDVDYRGSTGYGREYRQALDGRWGLADVADCVAAVQYLSKRGDVDATRALIRGGSAGGFTVLSALAHYDVFAAGASRYGVADLEALATDTHKFESRYLDSMIGPWPESKDVYEARSPINHVDKFSAPMIVLQGDEDAIVPPNQSEMIVAALEARGVPVSYLLFEGEQHGFRKAENVVTALESELAFFGEMLGFEPADDLPPVEIRR